MSKRKKRSRDTPAQTRTNTTAVIGKTAWDYFVSDGYIPMYKCPEVEMCVNQIASLVSSMTVKLMANTDKGDRRVINGLSRKIDIDPHPLYTRKTFFYTIVKTMLTVGEGNCVVVPIYTADGMIDRFEILKPSQVIFEETSDGFRIRCGNIIYSSDEVLNFVYNPDPERPWKGLGLSMSLKGAVECINQANRTKKALQSSPTPSILVKIDGLNENLQDKDGRQKLLDRYIDSERNGEPWIVSAETMDITTIKPLTMTDLAIKQNLELDKRTVAGLMRVPSFMVGVGDFNKDEYKHFITTVIMDVAQIIQQVMTAGLIYSSDMYFAFNPRSLYSYDISELVNSGKEMLDRMAMRRNELRDWIGLEPDDEMDELLALENYIPASKLGDQKKLNGGGES